MTRAEKKNPKLKQERKKEKSHPKEINHSHRVPTTKITMPIIMIVMITIRITGVRRGETMAVALTDMA